MTIREIIKIARGLTDRKGAIVDRDSILSAFADRLDTNEEGYLKEDRVAHCAPFLVVSVEKCILEPTRKKLGVEEIEFVQMKDSVPTRNALYGYVDAHTERPAVVLRSQLRPCWERFTIAKELLHLYSGTASDKGTNSAKIIIMAAQESRSLIVNESTELDDEAAAFYLAIEVMLPWSLRERYYALKDAQATDMQIAKAFMIPVCIVEHVQSQSSGSGQSYLALSRRLNQNV